MSSKVEKSILINKYTDCNVKGHSNHSNMRKTKQWLKYSLVKSARQSGPQMPRFPASPNWTPESSTNVEHQGVMSPSALPSIVHWWCVTPLCLKGKMHSASGFVPLIVEQFRIPLSVMTIRFPILGIDCTVHTKFTCLYLRMVGLQKQDRKWLR